MKGLDRVSLRTLRLQTVSNSMCLPRILLIYRNPVKSPGPQVLKTSPNSPLWGVYTKSFNQLAKHSVNCGFLLHFLTSNLHKRIRGCCPRVICFCGYFRYEAGAAAEGLPWHSACHKVGAQRLLKNQSNVYIRKEIKLFRITTTTTNF